MSNKVTNERINKLPKWAQEHIEYLEMRNQELCQKVANFFDANLEDTNITLREGINERPLPPNSIISFLVGNDITTRIDVRHDIENPGRIVVCGGMSITVSPRSSNVVFIEMNV